MRLMFAGRCFATLAPPYALSPVSRNSRSGNQLASNVINSTASSGFVRCGWVGASSTDDFTST
jgi:hypothetical protein